MSTEIKPIKVWGKGGPNPPRVAIVLEELGLPYDAVYVPFSDVKKPEYVAINPNGRLPAIEDPNTGLTLWESGAIVEYLVERYDTRHRLGFPAGSPEAHLARQWLFLQATGQGPYYGQVVWFKKYHHEQLPSAVERYVAEVGRVTGVLERHLAAQKVEAGSDGPWLVGGRLSYADLAFVPWQTIIAGFMEEGEYDIDNFPHVKAWLGKMTARDAVKRVLDEARDAK